MGFLSVLSFAGQLAVSRIRPGDTVIDATAGNGVDTLMLARAVGPSGAVHAFDIQRAALEATKARLDRDLDAEGGSVYLHLLSHDRMKEVLPDDYAGRVAAVMFNLGYLPGPAATAAVITKPDTTLPALNSALELLKSGGVVTVTVYPGHEGGQAEADAVEAWAAGLEPKAYQVLSYRFLNRRNAPPYVIAVEKL